jgi:hypothetical protein
VLPREESQQVEVADAIFNPYWTERVTAAFRTPLLTRLFNTLLRNHRGGATIPLSEVKRIRAAIHSDSYGSDFGHFEKDVKCVHCLPLRLPAFDVGLTHMIICGSDRIG